VTRIQFITSEAAGGTQPTIHTHTVQNVQQSLHNGHSMWQGHNLRYTLRPMCKMFNKFAQIQFAQRSQYVAGTPPLPKWSLCKLKQQQFVYIAHSSVHVVRCAMHTLAFSVHLRWWSLNSSKRPRFVSHSLVEVEEKLQPTEQLLES